jgi:hypothetical protein
MSEHYGKGNMTKIYTISIPIARKLGLDEKIGYIDITIGSGDKVFAPTWKMVNGIKNGTMSEDEYTAKYRFMMGQSRGIHWPRWNDLLCANTVYLACYCPPGEFCHRYILANILVEEYGDDIEYMGEYMMGEGIY